jgi:protein-S-isoprenylcysteine O-methyltransferase Ste14
MNALENRIPPPLVALIMAVLMLAAARVTPAMPISDTMRIAVAVVVAMLGGISAVLGFRAFGRAKTTVDPVKIQEASALVTTGIYRYTRNPMYLGLTLLLLGWGIYLSAPWAMLGPAAFMFFITRFQIIPEERILEAKFGTAFTADHVMRHVGRYDIHC